MSEEIKFGMMGEQLSMLDNAEELSLGSDYEIDDDFSYDGFQVTRGEFFAHSKEPSISFSRKQMHVNTVCISKLPNTDYVQILINSEERKLAIRPCMEDDRDSFVWRSIRRKDGKRVPKQITCRLFYAKLFDLMEWNPDHRYKMIGKLIKSRGTFLFLFDLTAFEEYTSLKDEDGKSLRNSRGVFPKSWQQNFGMPVEEHDNSLKINTFNGYTVFGVKSKHSAAPEGTPDQTGGM